jgi:transposase
MSKSNRNDPKRSAASESRYTFYDFDQDFPDDATCLDFLVSYLYPEGIYCPKDKRVTKHHRIAKRPAYACQFCGHHEYPMRGTIFEGSATSLRLWFHAIFLMSQTRCGISAKQLERELGVGYKTAWRMANKIRSLLMQDDEPMGGIVEVDEAYIGGKGKWKHHQGQDLRPEGKSRKSMVVGMAQRRKDGGSARLYATVADPGSDGRPLASRVREKVLPASTVFTDETTAYWNLRNEGYRHERVNHQQKVYVRGNVHTNTVEGFWSLLKRGIGGVYHSVSSKHLQGYVDEYVFRYNHRDSWDGMFSAFLNRIEKASGPSEAPSA